MAKKQLNKNVVVGISLAFFALILVLSFVMLSQLQQGDPEHFARLGQQAADSGQWQQATVFYGQAWERSEDPKYLVALGETFLNQGEVGQARAAWSQALVRDPNLLEAHRKRMKLRMELSELYGTAENWQEVSEGARAMLAVTPLNPEDEAFARHADGMALLHLTVRDQSNQDAGLAQLRKAVELAPDEVRYATDLAAEHARLGQKQEAEQEYQATIQRFPSGSKGSAARVAYAGYLATQRDFTKAAAQFQEALKLAEGDGEATEEARLAHANFLLQQWALAKLDKDESAESYFQRAEQELKQLIEGSPESFKPYMQLALLYKAAAQFENVVKVAEQRLSRGLSRKGVQAAQNRVSTFTLLINASEASVALGLQAGRDGKHEEKKSWLAKAEQYVVDAKGEAPTHPRVMSQTGRVKLAQGLDRAALEDFRAAEEGYRNFGIISWENKLILADTHLRLNEPGAARALLEEVRNQAAVQRGKDPIYWNLYAQSLLQSEELEMALAAADAVLSFDPQNRDAKLIKAAIYERQGRHELAGEQHELASGTPVVRKMLEARSASMEGDSETAVAKLREALQIEPANVQLVGMAVNELIGLKRHDEAQQVVAAAQKEKPDDASLKQLAIFARPDLSEEERSKAMLEVINGEADLYKRSLDLVSFYSRSNEPQKALEVIDQALTHLRAADTPTAQSATASQRAALLKTKIRVAGQLDDEQAMASARDEAAEYNVDGAKGASILGLYHIQRREFELAINALRDAVAMQPSDAMALTLLGQCYQALGREEDAKAAYERAIAANRDAGPAHQGLAALAQAHGDKETFQAELAITEKLMPQDPWVQEQVLIRSEDADPQSAIGKREAQLAQKPDDIYNIQRLASLYENVGDLENAERQYMRLRELQPEEQRVAQATAAFYRRTKRPEKAIETLQQYIDGRPDDKAKASAMRAMAAEYIQQRDIKSAENVLADAIALSPTVEVQRAFGDFYVGYADQPKKAIEMYTAAIETAEKADPQQVPGLLEARIITRLHRSLNDIQGARGDVEILQRRFPEVIRGYLWASEVNSRSGNIAEAVNSLSAYLNERPDDAYGRYQRARHYVAQGANGPAIRDLEVIKRVSPLALQLEPRLLLSRLYRRMERQDDWLGELEQLVQEAPNSDKAIQELATAYVSAQRFDDADRLVTAQINRGGSTGQWYFLRGNISLQLGDPAKALKDFEQAARAEQFSAASVANVLQLYAKLGQFDRGIEYFKSIQDKVASSPIVLARYARLLAGAKQDGPAVEQFRQAMALAIAKDPGLTRAVGDELHASYPGQSGIALFSQPPADASLARANDRLMIRLYAIGERFDDSVALLDKMADSAATDGERAGLLHEKGTVLQLAKRADDAIVAYERALEYDPRNWVTLNNLAFVLADEKQEHQRALAHAQRAVAIADNAYTLDTLGWIYVGLKQYPLAIAELSRAIRLDPDYAWAYYHLGEAHRRAGQFSEALEVLNSGRDVAQGDPEILRQMDASAEKASRNVSD